MKRWLAVLLLAVAGGTMAAPPATSVQPLSARDIARLLTPPAQGERILMFWALHCVYCEPNMEALAKLQRAHPEDIQLVLVDTDDINQQRQKIEARLQSAGMSAYPAWAYTEAAPQRLNFLIDSNWGGETPRTLVILANGHKAAVSGELTAHELAQLWPLPQGAH